MPRGHLAVGVRIGAEMEIPKRSGPGRTVARRGPSAALRRGLTRAEMSVARLVAEGLSNPQIAMRLYISRHTVETHMKHIFGKLGVHSRAALAANVASRTVADGP